MTRQTINRILFYFLFILSPVYSQVINNIEITSTGDFSSKELTEWSMVSNGAQYFPSIIDTIKSRINNGLNNKGYFLAKYSNEQITFSSDSLNVFLTLHVDCGEPTFLNEIYANKLEPKDSIIFYEKFEYLKNDIFFKDELESAISELLTYYEDNAFPFVSVKIKSINLYYNNEEDENLADLYLSVDKGSPSTINNIEIIGNDKTKDYVITRELRLEDEAVYSQKRIEEIPKILNRLKYFDPVAEPKFYYNSKDEGTLQIIVKEKQTNNFDGIIGYVPASSGEDNGYLTGYLNIGLKNLFGTGRAVGFKWEKLNRYSELLDIKYLEPWIIGLPFNIQVGLNQRKQDTTYVQRNYNGSIEYLATENLSASLLFESESTIPTESENNRSNILNSNAYTTGFDLRFDTRNDLIAPSSGLLLGGTFKYSNKTINNPEEEIPEYISKESNLHRFEIDAKVYLELFKRHVLALSGNMRQIKGDFVEASDLYRFGGTNSLRGYREDQFRGNLVLWSNLEYRLAMSQQTYAFLFFDSGYYKVDENKDLGITKASQFLVGYGLGLSIETGLGILGVSYALGKGDSFSEGKIHFGLLNEF